MLILLLHHAVHAGQSGQLSFQEILVGFVQLETLSATQQRSVLEHVNGVGVEGPVGAFARAIGTTWHFEETVVERQIVTERILPTLGVLPVVRKTLHDVAVNVGQRQHPL